MQFTVQCFSNVCIGERMSLRLDKDDNWKKKTVWQIKRSKITTRLTVADPFIYFHIYRRIKSFSRILCISIKCFSGFPPYSRFRRRRRSYPVRLFPSAFHAIIPNRTKWTIILVRKRDKNPVGNHNTVLCPFSVLGTTRRLVAIAFYSFRIIISIAVYSFATVSICFLRNFRCFLIFFFENHVGSARAPHRVSRDNPVNHIIIVHRFPCVILTPSSRSRCETLKCSRDDCADSHGGDKRISGSDFHRMRTRNILTGVG